MAERQADAAHRQAEMANRQVETAQQTLLNTRYQQGAEMLGKDVLTVCLGGIYALQRLAEEHSEQYHVEIMQMFCAFVRNPTGVEERKEGQTVLEDVQAIMTAIGTRSEAGVGLEETADFKLYLRGAHVSRANLRYANLSDATLTGADISGASLTRANLSRAWLDHANLSAAWLSSANLTGAHFYDIAGIDQPGSAVKGLIQSQLDWACADPRNPPDLDGIVLDAMTGQPLVWDGRPLQGS